MTNMGQNIKDYPFHAWQSKESKNLEKKYILKESDNL